MKFFSVALLFPVLMGVASASPALSLNKFSSIAELDKNALAYLKCKPDYIEKLSKEKHFENMWNGAKLEIYALSDEYKKCMDIKDNHDATECKKKVFSEYDDKVIDFLVKLGQAFGDADTAIKFQEEIVEKCVFPRDQLDSGASFTAISTSVVYCLSFYLFTCLLTYLQN